MYPHGMANQIVLAWVVDVGGSPFSPAQAAVAISQANAPLYGDLTTDPMLGQMFGLTVESDVTSTPSASTAKRTLTLNMNATGARAAPPPFPCHPRTTTPPVLPYPLRESKTLPGSFFVSLGSTVVPTTATQIPSLSIGDSIQFLSEPGVFYEVASLTATVVNLTAPYTGATGNTGAFKEIIAPVTIAAFYSSSDLDTAGVATTPAIPAGSGAQTVSLTYDDSLGNGPFTVSVSLTGKRPAAVVLDGASVDIAEVQDIVVTGGGDFGNSVGEITLVELSSALPPILVGRTPLEFAKLTDEAQLLIAKSLAYIPQSYPALAAQNATAPQLAGDFLVSTGSVEVPTSVDQSSVLAPGDRIQFASDARTSGLVPGQQRDDSTSFAAIPMFYVVATVTPKIVTITTPYLGIDDNFTGGGPNANAGTKGNLGSAVRLKPTAAFRPASAAPPTNDQLAMILAQFVAPETAMPPLNPPLTPMTPDNPPTVAGGTTLSGIFTRTLQLALAGVPVVPQAITFV